MVKIIFSKLNKRLTSTILMVLVFVCVGSQARAAWPTENLMGMTGIDLGGALNSVEQKAKNIILARMQQEAIKQIQDTMGNLIMGDGYNSYIITDYDDFIYGTSQRAGKQMLTDFFKRQKEGLTPGEKDVLRMVEARVKEDMFGGLPKQDMGQYVETETGEKANDPIAEMFSGDNLDAWVHYETSPFNKPENMVAYTEAMLSNYMNRVRDVQRTKAIANQGFDPKNGVPGSVISQLVAQSEGAPIEMISNATTAEQVISNLATSTLTSFMRTGYGRVSMPGLNQVQKINEKYEGGIGELQRAIYEGQN